MNDIVLAGWPLSEFLLDAKIPWKGRVTQPLSSSVFFLSLKNMKESDNYFYPPLNCTNYQPISSQYDRHSLSKTHRDKLALIGFSLAVWISI